MSPRSESGRRRGRPGRPATGGMPSTRVRVWVTSLTFAAVVMTLNGVPRPSQIRSCLLPVFHRSTGDGPVSTPSFSCGCGSRPRTRGTSRVRRVEFGEQDAVPLVEDPGLLPAAQAPPAGLSEPNPSSTGKSCQVMSLWSMCRMPCRHSRSAPAAAPAPPPARAAAAD